MGDTKRGPGRPLEVGEKRVTTSVKLAPRERAAVEAIQEARGAETLGEALRSLPEVWTERDTLLRMTLEPVRGRLATAEINVVLDVMNGLWIMPELAGQHVIAEVADGCALNGTAERHGADGKRIVKELASWTLAQRAALEMWCGDLWRRYENNDLWKRETEWLSSRGGAESRP